MGGSSTGVRLAACLPLRLKNVSNEAKDRRLNAVLSGPKVQRESNAVRPRWEPREDPIAFLASRIEALEHKVDTLISLILRNEQQAARESGIPMELHGEGVAFRWTEPFSVGQILELEVTLSLLPAVDVVFLAEVIDCNEETKDETTDEGEENYYLVDARFVAIGEGDLDAVHRFIFTSQREQRRWQREGGRLTASNC
ncbi:MAG: hypothetical protein V1754_14855 [Pseudomonadota bacterium]